MAEKRFDLTGERVIKLTKPMTLALAHAATSEEQYAVGFAPMGDALAEEVNPGEQVLVVEAYLEEENGGTPLLINYAWNEEGGGAWLEPDGGWHYQPGEVGYYPWRMDQHEHVLGLTNDQARDLLATVDTFRQRVRDPDLRARITALLDNIAAQLGATKEGE